MNIQAYIASGLIENHVLGLTSQAEAVELERMCQQYPEIQQALREAEDALANYALLHSETPPANTKNKILQTLMDGGEINQVGNGALEQIPAEQNTPVSTTKISSLTRIIAIAASVLFVSSVVFHMVKVADYQNQIHQLQQEKTDLIAQNETFMAQIQRANREITIIGDPAFKTVILDGVPGHDESRALVYWDVNSNEVYLKPDNLPALPEDKQYQLWGIVDGQPVSAGVYDAADGEQGFQQMLSFAKADMFAITIEQAGGSEHPTLDQMVVAGKT